MKFLKIIIYKHFYFFSYQNLIIFGYWFKKENFGIYMRKRKKNKLAKYKSSFNGKNYDFFYQRNFWGFRGDDLIQKMLKLFSKEVLGNQRFTLSVGYFKWF